MSKEIRALIFRMVAENPTWGAPDPRRTAQARFRSLGNDSLPVDSAMSQSSRSCQTLADFPEESP